MKHHLALCSLLWGLHALAHSFVDATYFQGCQPVAGQVSCNGKAHIAANGGYGLPHFPANISGYPQGRGHSAPQSKPEALLSLGTGGYLSLRMTANVQDLPGPDLRVFENPLYRSDLDGSPDKLDCFMDWAFVEVSQDGVNFHRFPAEVDRRHDDHFRNPYRSLNFAGVFPVYANTTRDPFSSQVLEADGTRRLGEGPGGDDFDLSSLPVNLSWIRYVRIVDAREPGLLSSSPTAGFDLDTVVGLH